MRSTAFRCKGGQDYHDDELDEPAGCIDAIVDQALQVHALVNVHDEDQGVPAARRLTQPLRRYEKLGPS
jgi:hypothetical protein